MYEVFCQIEQIVHFMYQESLTRTDETNVKFSVGIFADELAGTK